MAYEGFTAPASEEVAQILFRALFEIGPNRLSSNARYVAVQTITGALKKWREQLLQMADDKVAHEKKKGEEWRREAAELRLRLNILEKEKS